MDVTISEYILLKDFTTFRIGGPARFFAVVKTLDELEGALQFAKDKKVPVFILGGGSNILVSDEGFLGLVIKIEISGIEVNEREDKREVIAGAGVDWDEFVAFTVEQGLFGLENLSLIPGTVGAAPVQNIGAYGAELKDVLSWVEAVNQETGELETLSNTECRFSYRDSMFKKPEGSKYVITRVAFLLTPQGKLNTEYKDIANYLSVNDITDVSLQKMREIVIDIRTKKLPDVKKIGTAGSFFKNPVISKANYEDLLKQYPGMPHYQVNDDLVKIPAAWILDTLCGFKGYRDGDVGVYENQALVLVNFGTASAVQIKNLAEKMIACVQEKTNIKLEMEVQMIF